MVPASETKGCPSALSIQAAAKPPAPVPLQSEFLYKRWWVRVCCICSAQHALLREQWGSLVEGSKQIMRKSSLMPCRCDRCCHALHTSQSNLTAALLHLCACTPTLRFLFVLRFAGCAATWTCAASCPLSNTCHVQTRAPWAQLNSPHATMQPVPRSFYSMPCATGRRYARANAKVQQMLV